MSPFGPSSSSAAAGSSPFGGSGAASKRPFAEPAGLSPNMPTPKQASRRSSRSFPSSHSPSCHACCGAAPPALPAALLPHVSPPCRRPRVTITPPRLSSRTPASPLAPAPQDTAPWWTKITLTQIVIVLSFTTIISLMVGTFFFVLSTGAIRFNE